MSRSASTRLAIALAMVLPIAGAVPVLAAVDDHGPAGEYFYDDVNGIYWFDPGHFHGQAHVTVDLLNQYSTVWSYATAGEIENLLGQDAGGVPLEEVLGERTTTLGGGGPRWIGFYLPSGEDGMIVQSDAGPGFETVTDVAPQANAGAYGAGAWFVAAVDPVVSTAAIEDAGIFFHDLLTDLYWYDPSEFFGVDRADIEIWLGANPAWRWATRDDVYRLLGKRTSDGSPLVEVMGPPSTTLSNDRPRWMGYFAEDGIVNGMLLQADIDPLFDIFSTGSTQANAAAFNPGAWLVTDVDPTPNEAAGWGDVKRSYR